MNKSGVVKVGTSVPENPEIVTMSFRRKNVTPVKTGAGIQVCKLGQPDPLANGSGGLTAV